MTINIANNDPRINYTATAGQTVFTVPFEFFDNTDIKVYIEGTLKTITTHYTVSGGNGSTGTVTLTAGATLNDEVTLVRDVPMERTTDLTSSYNGSSIDAQLDRIVAQIADLDDKASRTIQINDYELASGLLLPALDNRKGKTIQFNTSTGALEVGPTGADLTAIGSVTSEIATLASISSDITTVAGANAAITAVGNSMTSVNAINAALSNVNSVAGGLTNINLVGGSIADVNDVADSLGEISAVQAKLTNIDTVAVASTNIGTVAGSITQVNNVASNISDVTGVNTNMSAITTANANSANINLVASSIDDVNDVGTVITKVTTVADNIANVNLVAPVAQYMSDVANNITAISAVAPLAGDLANVTSNLSAIQNAATNATNAANSATAAANSATSIGNAEVTTTANAVAAANSAAAAATALDNFDDKYLGVKSSDPTVDNDGDALVQGALYFSSSSSAMQVYDGANWIAASSSGVASLTLFEYTATAGQTAFSGSDDNGLSMSFIAANLLVTMNGVILDPSDYTTTSGLTVTLDVGAAVNDVVNIYAFKSFQVADTVPATTGGTFIGPVTFNSNVTVGGTVDGRDLATDGTKLDGIATSANNYVHPSAHPISFITGLQTALDNINTDLSSDTSPQLGGNLDVNGNDITSSGDLTLDVAGDITLDADGGDIRLKDNGTQFGVLYKDSNDFSIFSAISDGDIKLQGLDGSSVVTALTLDMSDAGTATFNNKIKVGGTTLTGASLTENGDFTIDVGGNITLDADGGNVRFKDGGTEYGTINKNGANLSIYSSTSNADMQFHGNDNGTIITALTLDMSDGGKAIFNNDIVLSDNRVARFGNQSGGDLRIYHDGTHAYMSNTTGNTYLQGGGQFRVQSASGENHFIANADGAVNLYYDNALKLATTSSGVTVTGTVAATSYTGDGSNLTGVGGSTTWGAVGTYTVAATSSTQNSTTGSTVAGSTLIQGRDSSGNKYFATKDMIENVSGSSRNINHSGTWRNMGPHVRMITGQANFHMTTLWVRIS